LRVGFQAIRSAGQRAKSEMRPEEGRVLSQDSSQALNFTIQKEDWSQCRFESSSLPEIADGEALFRVDRFALTSNNITYAAAGDLLNYWGFFPAEKGWGRIPAMGFADVVASRHPEVSVGRRAFGFFPMSTHLLVRPEEGGPAGFVDGVEHRKGHAPFYRQYAYVSSDSEYEETREDQFMLLRGLFMTSFLVDSFLSDNDGFGARTFLIGSASSKTGIALAYLLSRRSGLKVIGVTSPRNRQFVEGLGLYDSVIDYDAVTSLDHTPTTFIDHSGDGGFVNQLHQHLGDALKYHCVIGATHWDSSPRNAELPGPEPTLFFAPAEAQKRTVEWGVKEFQKRVGKGWREFSASSDSWIRIERATGEKEVERIYRRVLAGEARPSEGHVLSLWDLVS
jgi:NADPH:quinone reductase-like Zn-dependent oxidoreductase